MKGCVYLVGAGPGDPGLLTLKGLKCLQKADLVVHDYLANPEHLRFCKADTVKIAVGKGFRHKTIPQHKINRLIVSLAKKGKTVVRLKGGDPYLFGRGGEEALYLKKNAVPFEVIPGVTSAVACAAYAGIPMTHRTHNASVTFLTGHRANDNSLDSIAWDKIAKIGGTLVVYMGFYNLPLICRQLMRAGMSPKTPAAVIEWGTLPRQKTAAGTLGTIDKAVLLAKMGPPCIIIIGDVVGLRQQLNWYERLPLFGKKIVVTRASERADSFKERLNVLGAEVIELPLIRIEKLKIFKGIDSAIRNIHRYAWLIVTSAYGVEAFFERLHFLKKDARWLSKTLIAGVGPETGRALARWGISADLVPDRFESAAIPEAIRVRSGPLDKKNILLLRTDIAPKDLDEGLKGLGARIHRVTAYKTLGPKTVSTEAKKRILSGQADYVAFTSASTVNHFVRAFGCPAVRKIAKKTKFLSIGPVTSKTLKSYGLKPYLQADTFTVDGLIDKLLKKSRP